MYQSPAKSICQSVLDPLTRAILAEDVEGFVQGIRLPFECRTLRQTAKFDTLTQVQGGVRAQFARSDHSFSQLALTCECAAFLDTTSIEGYARLGGAYHDGTPLTPQILRLRVGIHDAGWALSLLCACIDEANWPLLPGEAATLQPRDMADKGPHVLHLARFQAMLNWLSRAALSRDYEAWRAACQLPTRYRTGDTTVCYETEEDLKRDFDAFQISFDVHRVTDIMRDAIDLEHWDDRSITGSCRTYLLHNGELVVPPYVSRFTLTRGPDLIWRLSEVDNALGPINWRSGGTA